MGLVEPGTVVFVDDDCEVRQSIADLLTIEGYEARPFPTADAAWTATTISGTQPRRAPRDSRRKQPAPDSMIARPPMAAQRARRRPRLTLFACLPSAVRVRLGSFFSV
jgi:hypothetical protein